MTVDVGFKDSKPTLGPIAAKNGVKAINTTGLDRHKLASMMESRRVANIYKNELDAALSALSAANADIDRLNGEVDRLENEVKSLNEELKNERERNASAPSKKLKGRQAQKQQQEKEKEDNEQVCETMPDNPPCDPELPFG